MQTFPNVIAMVQRERESSCDAEFSKRHCRGSEKKRERDSSCDRAWCMCYLLMLTKSIA